MTAQRNVTHCFDWSTMPFIAVIVATLAGIPSTVVGQQPVEQRFRLAEDEYRVGGRVVTPAGKPASGVNLYVVDAAGDADTPARAVSDADGRFDFTMKKSEFGLNDSGVDWQFSMLLASGDGYGVDFQPAYCFELSGRLAEELAVSPYPAADQWDRTLRLVRDDVPVAGRIVDAGGQPVAGATMRVMSIWAHEEENLDRWNEAVEKGEDYDVVVLEMMDRHISLGAESKLLPTVQTGQDGTFKRHFGIGRERIAKLLIEGPGIVSETVFVRSQPGPLLRLPHVLEAPWAGTYRFYGTPFEHVTRPSRPIAGKVVDADSGAPIVGVLMRLRAGNRRGQVDIEFAESAVRAVTDKEGRYQLSGAPVGENHKVLALPADSPHVPAAKKCDSANGKTARSVDFQLKRGIRVHGRITDALTGEPVQAMVTYFIPTENPHTRKVPDLVEAWITPWQAPYLTDEEGRYTNVALPGKGYLAVNVKDWRRYPWGAAPEETKSRHPDWPNITLRTSPVYCLPTHYHHVTELDLHEGTKSYKYDIVLSPGQQLKGEVRDPEGEPIAGTTYRGLTEGDGPYFHLASSTFEVNCYRPDRPRTIYFVHMQKCLAGGRVLHGPQESPLVVQLEPWGVITGRIVNEDGKPRGNQLIRGYAPGHGNQPGWGEFPKRHYHTDANGRFRIEGLVPGLKYDLDVIEDGRVIDTTVSEVTVDAGEVRELGNVLVQEKGANDSVNK